VTLLLRPVRDWCEFYLVLAVVAVARALPYRALAPCGTLLGGLAWLVGIRRRVVLENLRLCFPEWTERRRRQVARGTYRHFAVSLLELLHITGRPIDFLDEKVSVGGGEFITTAREQGRGVIMLTGHIGSWELFAGGTVRLGHPFSVLVGTLHNPLVDAFLGNLRVRWGLQPIPRGLAAKGLFRALRQNRLIAILADQDARGAGIFVEFFGQPASTAAGPAMYALKTGAPMLFSHCIRRPDGTYRGEFYPLPEVALTGETAEDARRLTRAMNEALEAAIRQAPEQYFWFHKRFKTAPGSGKEAGRPSAVSPS
jgi:Kdo2-lipid IVA lauroyltransferase/acyltransferase